MLKKSENQLKYKRKPLKYMCFAITLCVLLASNILGQSITWQRTYDSQFHGNDLAEDICDAGNENYFVVGTTQRLNSYSSIFLLKINKFGDTLWTRYIDTAYGKAITPSGDGGCVISGLKNSSFSTKIDSDGNIVWFKTYTVNIIFNGLDIIKTKDSGYLICGVAYYDIAYVIKLDSVGNYIWEKFYSAGYRKGFRNAVEGIDGGYVLVGLVNNYSTDTTRGLITKIDEMGNVINEKTFVLNGNTGVYDIDKTNNEYLLCGDTYDGVNFRVFMQRVDIKFNDIFRKVFISDDDEFTARIKAVNNNRYIMSMSRLTNSFPFRYYSKIILTDSLGNILNQNTYNAPKDLNIYSILSLSNRDILFAGLAEYITYSDVYVLRTDSLFIAPPPIGIYNIHSNIREDNVLNNFPNPFNSTTNIKIKLDNSSSVKIDIVDINGKTVEKLTDKYFEPGILNFTWTANNYASGIYFILFYTNNKLTITKKIILLK